MPMRITSNAALRAFAVNHPQAAVPLHAWRRLVESREFLNLADIKTTFNAADKVGLFYVFDIGGNKYRIVASIHFNTQKMYIRHVLTHQEYNKWKA